MTFNSDDETRTIVVKQRSPLVDGKTVVIGGGIVALILFLFYRGSGGGSGTGAKTDNQPLLFKLRSDGLWLGTQQSDIASAIARVKQGGRKDVSLYASGDVSQGIVDGVIQAFVMQGIEVYQRQSVGSMYQRGLGGVA